MTNKLPPEIYRRRRIAALVLLIVILVLLGWGVSSLFGGEEETADPASVTRSDGQPVNPPAKPAEPYPSAAASESEDATETSAEVGAKTECTLADLQLSVTSDRPNYGSEQPRLGLTIANPTGGECVVDLNQERLRFEVYELDTYQRVWSDVDCNDSEGQGELRLGPGEEQSFAATWSRLSSAPGKCSEADRSEATAGPYLLYGLVGSNNSEAYTFNLR